LRGWFTSEDNLCGRPQATVALGALRLPAPRCIGMPGACFERLPHHVSAGVSVDDARTKRRLWSYMVGSPGEVALLFTARLSAGMNTASCEGWDICTTQLVLDSCPRFRRSLPGELRARCYYCAIGACASYFSAVCELPCSIKGGCVCSSVSLSRIAEVATAGTC
jgi:hypothetical protein